MLDILPNFILAGVEKSGTTWLYHCLLDHPDIYLPPYRSEVHFFDRNYRKGLDFYKKFYRSYKGQKAIGDMTPSYMYKEKIAELISFHMPNAKIMFSLRNPVDRCYSDYLHLYRNTKLDLSFNEMIRNKAFLNKSFYYAKVKKYFDCFPKEKILVILFENLTKKPALELKKIYQFLEVDDNFVPSSISKEFNVFVEPKNLSVYRYIMKILKFFRFRHDTKYDFFVEVIKKLKIKEILSKKVNKPKLAIENRRYLFNLFHDDIKNLSDLINLNLLKYWQP